MVQIDFSENYECKEQNEIQSVHWDHTQMAVFTGVVWYLHSDNTIQSQSYMTFMFQITSNMTNTVTCVLASHSRRYEG